MLAVVSGARRTGGVAAKPLPSTESTTGTVQSCPSRCAAGCQAGSDVVGLPGTARAVKEPMIVPATVDRKQRLTYALHPGRMKGGRFHVR